MSRAGATPPDVGGYETFGKRLEMPQSGL
jgi:hypothetical protein